MSSKLRALTAALILCLIVVPAAVRATRTFDPGPRPRLAPSFNKSFDVPPDVAVVLPDVSPTPSLHAIGLAPSRIAAAPILEPLHVAAPLRGPPASVRS